MLEVLLTDDAIIERGRLPEDTCDMVPNGFGVLDAGALIEMNNLAVGYFPSGTAGIGVYPPLVPQPSLEQERFPTVTEQDSGTIS